MNRINRKQKKNERIETEREAWVSKQDTHTHTRTEKTTTEQNKSSTTEVQEK